MTFFVVVVVAVVHLKSFHPQKPLFLSFKNNTGQTYRQTERRTDGHDLLQRCVVASKKKKEREQMYTEGQIKKIGPIEV